MPAPTLEMLTTVAGAALLTAVLMQYVVLALLNPTPPARDRFGPLLAILTGIVVVELATFTVVTGATRLDFGQGLVNGIFAGLAAMGLHDVGKTITKSW